MTTDTLLRLFNKNEECYDGIVTKIFEDALTVYVNSEDDSDATIQECLLHSAYRQFSNPANCTAVTISLLTRYTLETFVNRWMQDYLDERIHVFRTIALSEQTAKKLETVPMVISEYLTSRPATQEYVDDCMQRLAIVMAHKTFTNEDALRAAVLAEVKCSMPRLYNDFMLSDGQDLDTKLNCIVQGVLEFKTVTINDVMPANKKGSGLHAIRN